MIPSTSIRLWFLRPLRWVKTIFSLKRGLIFLLVVLFSAFVAVMVSENLCWISPYLGLTKKNETLTFLGIGMGGILLALQAVIANKRAQAMEDAANAQADAVKEQAKANQNTEQGQRQERFKNAIEHLGHPSDSVRLGGAYELFHLAKDTKELRQTIFDILCAHIRQTTGEKKYREDYPSKPSEEVQSLLTLLFVQDHEVFKGCHINLQGSWLKGSNLYRARLRDADISAVQLQGAGLADAQLQGAFLAGVQLQGARLVGAQLQEALLTKAQLQGARLTNAQLQEAFLEEAQLQGAFLVGVQLQGAILAEAQLQGAILAEAQLQGAILVGARLQGTTNQNWRGLPEFKQRIRNSIGKDSDLSMIIFGGGLKREDVNSLVKDLSDENARQLRAELEPHIDKPLCYQLPENSGAITEAYTEEEAEQWIAEYEEAMSEVPKTDNGQ